MGVLDSALDAQSAEFARNRAANEALIADLKARVAAVAQGGGEQARAKHVARGKLLVRDRISELLDPGSTFLELSQLAATGLYNDEVASAGIVTMRRVNRIASAATSRSASVAR